MHWPIAKDQKLRVALASHPVPYYLDFKISALHWHAAKDKKMRVALARRQR